MSNAQLSIFSAQQSLAGRVRTLRGGESLPSLAVRAGINVGLLYRVESGEQTRVYEAKATALAKAFGLSVEEVFEPWEIRSGSQRPAGLLADQVLDLLHEDEDLDENGVAERLGIDAREVYRVVAQNNLPVKKKCAMCGDAFVPDRKRQGRSTTGRKRWLCQPCKRQSWQCRDCGIDLLTRTASGTPVSTKAVSLVESGHQSLHRTFAGRCDRCVRIKKRMDRIERRRRQERSRLERSVSPSGVIYGSLYCRGCGSLGSFVGTSPNEGCCSSCTDRIARKVHWHNRTEGFRNARHFDTVFDGTVYLRDNGICRWCKVAVPPPGVADPQSPNAFEADHIVPIAAGGEHTLRNMACSHRICNVRRTSGLQKRVTVRQRRDHGENKLIKFRSDVRDQFLDHIRRGVSFNEAAFRVGLNPGSIRSWITRGRKGVNDDCVAFATKFDDAVRDRG